jgi:glycosyltransferase involved in cell wall biosynthesis
MFCQFLSKLKGFERGYILFLLRRVYAFVVLTDGMKSNIHCVFPDKRVFILPNPINLQQMINEEGIERAENDLLYLGWYVREKGVYELVDAIHILVHKGVNIHMNFYGTKELENLKSYVKKKNLTEKITVNGWITGKKKLKTLYESTALILPSHTEGIPNVILEAMATKTPIIATLVGGLKEILKDGENAIIAEAGNPRDLSEKILKCLQDKELRDRIAANAYQDSGTKYDVHIIKEKFGQIIKNVTV